MITYEEALSIIQREGNKNSLSSEDVALEESVGRVLATSIKAPIANQPFDNSAMDGFALRTEDLAEASNDNPAMLEMIGHLAAGGMTAQRAPQRGQCYEIMTGAPMPPGCDTVVPVEKSEKGKGGRILFRSAAPKGDNIRPMGADFNAGDPVLDAGTCIKSEHILALATLGIGKIQTVRKPKVAILSTGQEVVDDLSQPLRPGHIYNSTAPYLRVQLPCMGANLHSLGTVGDDVTSFKSKLLQAAKDKCDIIISTGAVSAGVHDFVPSALKELGAEIFFHKVAIRPGKPILFAKLPDNGPFFFGLPGNPVSTAVGLRFFVQPLLRALQNQPPEQPQKAVLAAAYAKKKADLRFFLRASLQDGKITILEDQQSFMVSPFTKSDVWVSVGEDVSALSSGDTIGHHA